ncbi:TraK family protein [Xenorhabdus bovienii]|uniref:TraK family protein n=1 Tax=Xenorhabdus bovienii TaxID=40576 RepID=UPI003DA40450
MAKSLSQRIAERQHIPRGKGGANRAEFLAQKKDIIDALQDGWSSRQIWDTLYSEGRITFSYDPFTKYVNKIILSKKKEVIPQPPEQKRETRETEKNISQTPKGIFSVGLPTFKHKSVADD